MRASDLCSLSRVSVLALASAAAALLTACGGGGGGGLNFADRQNAALTAQGREIFRFDTFGDEAFWTDTLRINEPIEQAVTPRVALGVGLKVDSDALPDAIKQGIINGSVNLDSTTTTLALIKLNAVIGVKGTVQTVNGVDRLTRVGITCALCHSTVDNSFPPFQGKIGKRLDGWPNLDLNPGAIIALSPVIAANPAKKAVYQSWGPGMYDARFSCDGLNKPTVIPPAYGLQGVNSHTFTGDGADLAYWNRYVAVTQMGGLGTFTDARLANTPEAACASVTNGTVDLVSDKLPALQAYQLSIAAPRPAAGTFDATASVRGQALFAGKAQCATCHTGPKFTDGPNLHPKADSIPEPETPSAADRSATGKYRTTPLRALALHAPYFHDGSSPTLADVVARYNTERALGLTAAEMADLTEYLKSL